MIDFASTATFGDLHHYLKAITAGDDLYTRIRATNDSLLKVAARFAEGRAPLIMSDYSLNTIERVLMNPSVDKNTGALPWEPYTAHEAAAAADAVTQIVLGSGGYFLTDGEVQAGYATADAALPAQLKGRGKGQVDHEDLSVIGACIAAVEDLKDRGVPAEQARVVLVSHDEGILNCRNHLVRLGVCVIDTVSYLRAAQGQDALAA